MVFAVDTFPGLMLALSTSKSTLPLRCCISEMPVPWNELVAVVDVIDRGCSEYARFEVGRTNRVRFLEVSTNCICHI